MLTLNTHYPCLAVTSMQIVSIGDQDFIVGGLSNGKVIQMNLDISLAMQIINQPEDFPP